MPTERPHVTVAAVIPRGDKYLCVEERIAGAIVLNQPAGHLEHGETLIDAVKREVLEETAYHFEPVFFLGVYLAQSAREQATFVRVCFSGHTTRHEADRALDAEIVDAVWKTSAELRSTRVNLRSAMVLQCLDDFESGRRYPLDAVHDFAV